MKIVKTLSSLKLMLLVIIGLTTAQIQAQKKQKKVKIYKACVELNDNSKQKGFLYTVDNESFQLIDKLTLEAGEIAIIKAKDIFQIKIKRKGKIGNSILVGGLSGVAFGGILGYVGGDDPPGWFSYSKEDKAAMGAFTFGVLGTSIGAIVGTGRMKFDIKGNEALFKSIGFEKYAFVKGDKN